MKTTSIIEIKLFFITESNFRPICLSLQIFLCKHNAVLFMARTSHKRGVTYVRILDVLIAHLEVHTDAASLTDL